MKVTSSDKLDNKLSNKQTESDNILAEIVCIWPELPEHIKAGIIGPDEDLPEMYS